MYDYLLVTNSNVGPNLHRFDSKIRWRLQGQNRNFSRSYSHLSCSLWVNHFECLDQPHLAKRVLTLSIRDPKVRRFDAVPARVI